MYPGKPLANVAFKTYGYISMSQALMFLGDFKLGHYMKIPPKDMFFVQVIIKKTPFVTICFSCFSYVRYNGTYTCNFPFCMFS